MSIENKENSVVNLSISQTGEAYLNIRASSFPLSAEDQLAVLEALIDVRNNSSITSLKIEGNELNVTAIKLISGMKQLTTLDIGRTHVGVRSDERGVDELTPLGQLKNLKKLVIYGYGGQGFDRSYKGGKFEFVRQLPQLEELIIAKGNLRGIQVYPKDFEVFQSLPNLISCNAISTYVEEDPLRARLEGHMQANKSRVDRNGINVAGVNLGSTNESGTFQITATQPQSDLVSNASFVAGAGQGVTRA